MTLPATLARRASSPDLAATASLAPALVLGLSGSRWPVPSVGTKASRRGSLVLASVLVEGSVEETFVASMIGCSLARRSTGRRVKSSQLEAGRQLRTGTAASGVEAEYAQLAFGEHDSITTVTIGNESEPAALQLGPRPRRSRSFCSQIICARRDGISACMHPRAGPMNKVQSKVGRGGAFQASDFGRSRSGVTFHSPPGSRSRIKHLARSAGAHTAAASACPRP